MYVLDRVFLLVNEPFPVERSRILTEDTIINSVLEREINSQIPGKAIAIIDRDVLSPNGKYILLPAYTKIICQYEVLSQTGYTRLPVTCTRAIRPDGVSILLSNAISADQMGRTGLIGNVDNRTFERYGSAFILSGIAALAQSGVNTERQSWRNNSSTILSHNLGQVTSEVIKQNVDLRPIITIRAGSKIMIVLNTDIVLRKPIEVPS
jgi:type IV secretion system protein VirB10